VFVGAVEVSANRVDHHEAAFGERMQQICEPGQVATEGERAGDVAGVLAGYGGDGQDAGGIGAECF
jgi:hypothetical protein